MSDSYLDELNPQQRAAVEYLSGPQLVIAGAGSGKTRVLTYKIMHLLNNGYEPWRIMALTFTNKAADEMRSRIAKLVGDEQASKIWMGTFHSVFSRILRRHAALLGYTSNFTIYDTSDSLSLIRSIIREMGLKERFKPGTVLNEISNAKNNLIDPATYAADADIARANREAQMPELAEVYDAYARRAKAANAMDFDDILMNINVLMRDHPDILAQYRDHFRYVLVDEYQDTNFAQHLLVRQLCAERGNLCVVGDDAQSIYSFRGANIRNILDLRSSFPGLATFKLEQNYRSTSNIVEAANTLISKNKEQIPKAVFSNNGRGDLIEVVQAYDDNEEGRIVANAISKVHMRDSSYSEIAILYRTNSQSRIFEEALRNRNIPYRVVGGTAFYQRREIKDALAYLRLALNPHDNESMRRVINVPSRKIGDKTVEKLSETAAAANVSFYTVLSEPHKYPVDVNRGTLKRLADFHALVKEFVELNADGLNAVELAKTILEKSGLAAMYESEGDTPENISKRENLNELLKAIVQRASALAQDMPDGVYTLSEFLSEISLLTDVDEPEVEDRVTMMTIHAAKGLEFESVFIVGVEEDILPSARSTRGPYAARETEEERRLLYVAITRAKRHCMMSFARTRILNGKFVRPQPSRFLTDIDPRYLRMMHGTTLKGAPTYSRRPYDEPSYSTSASISFRPKPQAPQPIASRPIAPRPTAAPSPAASASAARVHRPDEVAGGTRILHDRFGTGTIDRIEVNGLDSCMYVTFDSDGTTRKLLFKFAKFQVL